MNDILIPRICKTAENLGYWAALNDLPRDISKHDDFMILADICDHYTMTVIAKIWFAAYDAAIADPSSVQYHGARGAFKQAKGI